MKRLSIFISAIAIISSLICLGWNGVSSSDNSPINNHQVSARYIVHFKPGVSYERMQEIYQQAGATLEKDVPQINAQVIKISSPSRVPANNFNYPGEVDYIEPDYSVQAESMPDDTYENQQWGLFKIHAPEAWGITHSNRTIKIAVLDSGIDSSHPDLASKIVAQKNFTDSPTTEDIYGHGTHVAGIVAAITNNHTGIAGVAYNASLMNVKVLSDRGGGSYSWIIQGIIWAADNGAQVINMSMDGGVDSPSLKQAVDYAWSKGAVVIAAAGNNGNDNPTYPAAYPECIAVAATDQNDSLYSFSDYGNWVDVAAPGSSISTMNGGKYLTMEGTSMAAPFVSGLAGLAFAVARDTNRDGRLNDEVRHAIQSGADKIGSADIRSGRINAYKTITSLLPHPPSLEMNSQ